MTFQNSIRKYSRNISRCLEENIQHRRNPREIGKWHWDGKGKRRGLGGYVTRLANGKTTRASTAATEGFLQERSNKWRRHKSFQNDCSLSEQRVSAICTESCDHARDTSG